MIKHTYPKNEKLKSRKKIQKLFTEGKSVSKYPLRLVYIEQPDAEELFQISVSVSKRYFKNAVDRNYYKRILRESYRLNQHILKQDLDKPYAFMLFYQSKGRLTFQEVNQRTIELFQKFQKLITEA